MAGITTPDTIVDRVAAVIRQYVNAEVDLVDTANNTIAVSGDNHFTTPSLSSTDVVSYSDRGIEGRPIRIVVTDLGEWSDSSQFQLTGEDAGEQLSGAAEPSSALPRLQREMRLGVLIISATNGGSQTTAGTSSPEHGRRVCNRVGEAVRVILARYPKLSIPATTTAGITTASLRVISDRRAADVSEDAINVYRREIVCRVETIESRA